MIERGDEASTLEEAEVLLKEKAHRGVTVEEFIERRGSASSK